jgi:hypothetical protein
MIQVKINDTEMQLPVNDVKTLGELVEYVKSSIDPETIIIDMTKNDEPLSDLDWRNPIKSSENVTLKFITGLKTEFVGQRLLLGVEIANSLIEKLELCAQSFKQLRVHSANTEFSKLVEDLEAYITWLNSIFNIEEEMFAKELNEYHNIVQNLESICVQIQEQQVSSSWWALGDTLISLLLPLLNSIKNLVTESSIKFRS